MKLERWALIAEIIGAFAIVVSLVFVGLQVRQSNSLAAADALRDGTQIWTHAYMNSLGTDESAAFFINAINHCEELSREQRGRFFAMLTQFLSAYDNIFNQYESGRLREEVFVSISEGYYAITQSACAHRMLSEEFQDLPPWLLGPDQIEALSGRRDKMKLPSFFVN